MSIHIYYVYKLFKTMYFNKKLKKRYCCVYVRRFNDDNEGGYFFFYIYYCLFNFYGLRRQLHSSSRHYSRVWAFWVGSIGKFPRRLGAIDVCENGGGVNYLENKCWQIGPKDLTSSSRLLIVTIRHYVVGDIGTRKTDVFGWFFTPTAY